MSSTTSTATRSKPPERPRPATPSRTADKGKAAERTQQARKPQESKPQESRTQQTQQQPKTQQADKATRTQDPAPANPQDRNDAAQPQAGTSTGEPPVIEGLKWNAAQDEPDPLRRSVMVTENTNDVQHQPEHVGAAFQSMLEGKKEGTWAMPYLENVARQAWMDEYGQDGSVAADAPQDYLHSWIDAWSGGDTNVPGAKALNESMANLGLKTPESTFGSPSQGYDPYSLAPRQKYSNDCGVTAARSMLRANGYDADQDTLFADAKSKGYHNGNAWNGPGQMANYLKSFGMDAQTEAFSRENIDRQLADGKPVVLSTYDHYFSISGKDDQGNYILGATGDVVGMGQTASYDRLAGYSSQHTLITSNGMNGTPRQPANPAEGLGGPSTERPATNPRSLATAPSLEANGAGGSSYTVKAGDTLWDIAQRHGTTYQEIAARNGIANPDYILPGQQFNLNGSSNESTEYPKAPAPVGFGEKGYDNSSSSAFLNSVLPYAQEVQQETGIPANLMAAIAANETGYGNDKYTHGNNFFGIKADPGWKGPTTGSLGTWEVYNGQTVNIRDNFRAYTDPADSFRDFATFLQENPRYSEALRHTDDPERFIREVHKAGYATDPAWADKILRIATSLQ